MDQAIGVIDSGVGGLTVAHELMRQLPKERLLYVGDTLRCPYGPRSAEEVKKFTWEMVDFLLKKEIKMLVVACNTATAFALSELQEQLEIPVIGVINPGARAAINATKNMHIGVIGTEGTIRSKAYSKALLNIHSKIQINALACPLFVPMVEDGVLNGDTTLQIVSESLRAMKDNNHIDTLILGCTHYPLIKDTIQQVIGERVSIISSSEETARETSTLLEFHEILYEGERVPKHQFFTTGKLTTFKNITERLFITSGRKAQAVLIEQVKIN
ncbi:glutamate racemase [Virgibacillus flavescens]|uniref:glutamate racemase n=1 Tax=Virgibacillus flavescens TaxID=1611422 RepID=UPI003D32B74D